MKIRIKKRYKVILTIMILIIIGIFASCQNTKAEDSSATLYGVSYELLTIMYEIEDESIKLGSFEKGYNKVLKSNYKREYLNFEDTDLSRLSKKYRADAKYLAKYSEEYRETAEKYIETGDEKYKKEIKSIMSDIDSIRIHYDGCRVQEGVFSDNKKVDPLYKYYNDKYN